MKLSTFSKNIYSQFGEDGIIEKIFEIIEPRSKVCLEFGAWDGYRYSNTANLWANKGWTGILIEGQKDRVQELKKNINGYNCVAICRYVGLTEGNTLEDILKEYDVKEDIDLLSIDIDGDEYHILSTLKHLRPRVILCEYNPTIPYWLDIYSSPGNRVGASVSALIRIGGSLGYKLISLTETNCIFVIEQEYKKFENFNTQVNEISSCKYLNSIITSYSGEYFVHGELPYGITFRKIKGLKTDQVTADNIRRNRLFIIKPPFVRSTIISLLKFWRSVFAAKREL